MTPPVCTEWVQGHCAQDSNRTLSPTFGESFPTLLDPQKLERTLISLDDEISTTVISIDDSIPVEGADRQRLDLFSYLEFDDEKVDGRDVSSGDSILSSLSKEMRQLDLLGDQGSSDEEGDRSPWSLPR